MERKYYGSTNVEKYFPIGKKPLNECKTQGLVFDRENTKNLVNILNTALNDPNWNRLDLTNFHESLQLTVTSMWSKNKLHGFTELTKDEVDDLLT